MSAIGQGDGPGLGQPSDVNTPGNDADKGFDFERGYNELRPEFTRATQELSSTRERLSEYEQLFEALHDSDPEVQAAAMNALGLELDTGSPGSKPDDAEFVDPLEREVQELRGIVSELRSARELEASERESQQLSELRDEFIGESIGVIENNLKSQFGADFRFKDSEEEVLGNLAIAMADTNGVPDVQGAFNALYGDQGVLETNRQRWIASKTGAAVPPAGTSIPADQKPKTRAERIAYIDERVAAMEQNRA